MKQFWIFALIFQCCLNSPVYAQKKGGGGGGGSSGASSGGSSGANKGNPNTQQVANGDQAQGNGNDFVPTDQMDFVPTDQMDFADENQNANAPGTVATDGTTLKGGLVRPTRCTFFSSSTPSTECGASTPTSSCTSDESCPGVEICDDCSADECVVFERVCGDGICVPGEDCFNCPQDCTGFTSDTAKDPYCCGSDTTKCGDMRCFQFGQRCVEDCSLQNSLRSGGVSMYGKSSKMLNLVVSLVSVSFFVFFDFF